MKNAIKRKYSEDEFTEAVKNAVSIRQVLITLGLKPSGGNYGCVKRYVKELNLEVSHWTGQNHNKGRTLPPRRDLKEYLIENSQCSSNNLRKRLIREGVKESKCECCGIAQWNGKSAPLELDHINGINTDNRLENLRILCPNCHAQTDTYRGKNKKFI
jgi:Zn finger protein HypA/HybF involved in hydrogenase expression